MRSPDKKLLNAITTITTIDLVNMLELYFETEELSVFVSHIETKEVFCFIP